MSERTIVHLLRHGEVHNPEHVLYGRLAMAPAKDRRPSVLTKASLCAGTGYSPMEAHP